MQVAGTTSAASFSQRGAGWPAISNTVITSTALAAEPSTGLDISMADGGSSGGRSISGKSKGGALGLPLALSLLVIVLLRNRRRAARLSAARLSLLAAAQRQNSNLIR